MKILVFSQHFWPEHFPINRIATKLAERGHEVTVATGKPNYPDGEVFPGYSARGIQRERWEHGIEIVRVPLRPRGASRSLDLVRNYLSFIGNGLLHFPRQFRGRRFDAILVFASSPLIQAIPAVRLKRLTGARLAIWVQDLWPESLSATGHVRNRAVLHAAGAVGRAIYRATDVVLVQSRAFVEPVARYAARGRITYFPNLLDGAPPAAPPRVDPALLDSISRRFTVVFAGNLGHAQDVENIVAAAELLRDDPSIQIALVGSGHMSPWIARRREELSLQNLILPGRFPAEAMPAFFERAGALLVSLRDDPTFALTIPSKLQTYLAAGRPIVAALRGEGARVVADAEAGIVCAPGDAQALAGAVRRLAACDPSERARMGAAARQCFERDFDLDNRIDELVAILSGESRGE